MKVPLWERVLVRLHDRWTKRNARAWRDAEAAKRRASEKPLHETGDVRRRPGA